MKGQAALYGPLLAFGLGGLALVHAVGAVRGPLWALAYPAAALLAVPAVDAALVRSGFRVDRLLLPLTAALLAVGLVTLYRLAPDLGARQATAVCAGLVGLVAASHVASRPGVLARLGPACAAAFLASVSASLAWGEPRAGGPPWVALGGVAFQPVAVAQVFLVPFLATHLARGRRARLGAAAVVAAGVLVLLAQRDVGGAAAVLLTALGVAYVATGGVAPLAVAAVVFGGAVLAAHPLLPHLEPRLQAWLDPWADPAGSGYQTLQATFALASGGLLGTGPGMGHPDLVPAAHTDLTLVAVAEEWGFGGLLAVLALYALWTARVLRVAVVAPDVPSRLLAAGVGVAVAVQAFGVAAGNVRLLPLVGLPLPFLSYGGSWVLGHLTLLGLALGASHRGRTGAGGDAPAA